jgi:hypothetical protein
MPQLGKGFLLPSRGFVRKTRGMCAASKEWARFTGFGSVTGESSSPIKMT